MRLAVAMCVLASFATAACDRSGTPPRGPYVVEVDVGPAIAKLAADDEMDVDDAAEHLAQIGDPAVPALQAAIAREPKHVALGAIGALAQIGSPAADGVLVAVATGPGDEEVRATALLKLGEGGHPAAQRPLEAALDDPSPMVRQTAAFACGALCTSPAAIDRIVAMGLGEVSEAELGRLRTTLARLLAASDAATANHVREEVEHRTRPMLTETTPIDARGRAALLAADAGIANVEPVLVDVARGSGNLMLRLAAIQWLGRHGTAAGVPALDAALNDRTIAAGAAVALEAMAARGLPEARDVVLRIQRTNPAPARSAGG